MTNSVQFSSPILSCNLRVVNLVLASACALILIAHPVQAQTFSVLHGFTGQQDGGKPDTGVTLDTAGNLYGTTTFGGDIHLYGCENIGCGTVFKMTHRNSGWVLTPLYAFTDMGDGAAPDAPVSFGPGGLLYGSTGLGGNGSCEYEFSGCGVVFTLQPHPTACPTPLCSWIENPIHQFSSMSDGLYPQGNLLFDHAGNVYGTTAYGGAGACGGYGCGTVFELSRSGTEWTKTVIHYFPNPPDGTNPFSGLVMDSAGNLYGTTSSGGTYNYGTIYELSPEPVWTETVLHNFSGAIDGSGPYGGLTIDSAGNLYGATPGGGSDNAGVVYELSPSNGSWNFSVIFNLTGGTGSGPTGNLTFDAAGNLYGTTTTGGTHQCGSVFKLTPSGGQWTFTDLYDFTCGNDGGTPFAGVTLDANGNVYGTTVYDGPGGTYCDGAGCGVVWEITP